MSRLYARLIAREDSTAREVSEWRPCVLMRHDESTDFQGALVVASDVEIVTAVEISVRGRTGAKVSFPATPVKAVAGLGPTGASSGSVAISVSMSLCETLGVAKDVKECEIRVAEISTHIASRIEISILDGFVSKRDIWKFQLAALGTAVYLNHATGTGGNWMVSNIDSAQKVSCIIGSKTQVVFTSLCAQLVVFLALSLETWDFDEIEGLPYFEKQLQFLDQSLFGASAQNHHVTLVVTVRLKTAGKPGVEDFYEVLYRGNSSKMNKTELFSYLRQFFLSFPGLIGWKPAHVPSYALKPAGGLNGSRVCPYSLLADSKLCRLRLQHSFTANFPTDAVPVPADQCNVLEAMNLGFDQFSLVHCDRKLQATNFRVAVVYAGNGSLVNVDTQLCELTRDRVGYHRPVALLVCLKSRPLFRVPRIELAPSLAVVDASFLNLLFPFESSAPPACAKSATTGDQFGTVSSFFRPNPTPPPADDQVGREGVLDKIPLQRVATAAGAGTGTGTGTAQVDTWMVQSSGEWTFHELVGMRMAFDMQLVDDADKTTFGTTVSRTALRGKDMNQVQMRGINTLWSLRAMEGDNISISKTTFFRRYIFHEYQYFIRFAPVAGPETGLRTGSELTPVMTKCKHCESLVYGNFSRRRRNFHTPLSILWNQLDHIVTDPSAVLSSVLPMGGGGMQPGTVALNYRSRPAIKTNFFCLMPTGDLADHREFSVSKGVGVDPFGTSQFGSYGGFLSFMVNVEEKCGVRLSVNLNKRTGAFHAVKLLVNEGKDWVLINHDDGYMPPRLFLFSVEWLICHGKYVQDLVEGLHQAAALAGFTLVQLPHAQLFPPSGPSALWADREVALERLPLRPRTVFVFPDWVVKNPGNFFQRFLSKLTDCMKMLFLLNCPTPANLETEEDKTGVRRSIYLRYPCWTLMTRDGNFFAVVRADKCEVFDNYLKRASSLHADYFVELRVFLHNALVECEPLF